MGRVKWRGFVIPVGLIVLAEAAGRINNLDSDSLALPSAIALAMVHAFLDGSLINATLQTLVMSFTGMAIGTLLGIAAGIVLGISDVTNRLAEVTLESFRPIPSIALAPLALLIFGFGYWLEISIVAFATLWPALIFTRAAIAGIEPRLLEVASTLELSALARVRKIIIPAALPRIFVACRLSASIALIVAVTVEVGVNPYGLGAAMMAAQQFLNPALAGAILVWIGVIGWLLSVGLTKAQQHFFSYTTLAHS